MSDIESLDFVAQLYIPSIATAPMVQVDYVPVLADGNLRHDLGSSFRAPNDLDGPDLDLYSALVPRLKMLAQFVESFGTEELSIKGEKTIAHLSLLRFIIANKSGLHVGFGPLGLVAEVLFPDTASFYMTASSVYNMRLARKRIPYEELPNGEKRLFDSILTSISNLCWNDFLRKLGSEKSIKRQVFISYRRGNEEFVRALATRLGEEGFVPWLDEWEILAGDSVPGKIEDGLRSSVAFIPIISADYQEGKWATEELESAIHRRVEEGFPIVPVLLEQCEKPALIRHLRHVDFSDHDPQKFESRVAEIVDGINRLSKNPFR